MTRLLPERPRAAHTLFFLVSLLAAGAEVARAQTTSSAAPAQGTTPAGSFRLPPVVVTAQKEPVDRTTLPVSVTAVTAETLRDTRAGIVSDVASLAPNVFFTEFSARKLSNARFRGVGSSPANPSVTTMIDGVPQLNTNSANIDLLDVDQVEFVRGPQSALFGRNTLGGLIAISSLRPSLSGWTGGAIVPLGNRSARDARFAANGPVVAGKVGVGVSFQYGERDGFTRNTVTNRAVDDRSAFSGKGQVLWTPSQRWEARVIVSGERARDGDYALNDLGSLRSNPFQTARDYEGYTHRDVLSTTVLTRREGRRLTLSTTTGIVRWKTTDATDLDYSPLPLVRRDNVEESLQFTQEVRVASAPAAPVRLGDAATLRWQAGVFFFTQHYDQDAANTLAPFLLSPSVAFPVRQTSPQAALDDAGIGVYGHGTTTVADRVDVTIGARLDHERKDASLRSFFTPALAPPETVDADRSFSKISPQAALRYRLAPEASAYVSLTGGFKAGGFNPASPAGREAFGEERTWSVEGGVQSALAGGRASLTASVFRMTWDDLQLNLPNPGVPGQFFIDNVGGATSTGVEVEAAGRVVPGLDVFGSLGYTRARFSAASVSGGVPVGGNDIPNTPDLTAGFGVQVSRLVAPGATAYGRADASVNGGFHYDDLNLAEQEAYALANVRGGVRGRRLFVEGWVRNAFDRRYVPVAFAYGALAPSGFIGEMGRPRTFGVTTGVTF